MALPSFTPLDAQLYKWRPASEPLVWERRACGIENLDGLEIPNKKGHNDFFIAVTSHFNEPNLKLDQIVTALKQVWRRTLFHHPQVACSPVWKDGQLFLTYKPPADEEQVAKWIDHTVHCEIRGAIPVEVQQELEERRRRAGGSNLPSRPVSIHVIPPVSTQNDIISHSDLTFLFHLNHIFLDGSGAYSLIGLVLQDLALQVSTARGSPQQFNWEESVHRLPPAFISIIRSDQHLSGPSYDTALHQALADTMASQSSWGLKPSGTSSGAARNDFHVISAAHTDRIKSAARRAGINIAHLTHAAVFLVGLRSNPPRKPTESNARSLIASYFALDDRQYIDDKFQTHWKHYIPNCHGHGNIRVNDIHKYVLDPQAAPEEVCAKLIAIAKHLKHGYDACAQRPSRVTAGLALMEILAGMIAAYVIFLENIQTTGYITNCQALLQKSKPTRCSNDNTCRLVYFVPIFRISV